MATHSSAFAWEIPWTEEPGSRQSMGLQRVRHDWVTNRQTEKQKHWVWMDTRWAGKIASMNTVTAP